MDTTGTGNFLARCTVSWGLHQLYPSNPEGYLAADNYTIRFNDHFKVLKPPYTLTWHLWNLDDTYPHRLRLRVGVLSPTVLPPYPTLITALNKISAAMAEWFATEKKGEEEV